MFPPVDALAALDAVRELLSDAKSGDLAYQGDTISPQTVEEWLAAHLWKAYATSPKKFSGSRRTDAVPVDEGTGATAISQPVATSEP